MKTYYLTFGSQHPLCDGWVEVEAQDFATAREYVFDVFGPKWANLYTEEKFKPDYFPQGKVGRTIR